MKNWKPVTLALAMVASQSVAALAEESCALTYETYEFSVPHTDMEACPASMASDGTFCRGVLNMEIFTVFAFSEEDGCLVSSAAYEPGDYTLVLE